MAPRVGNEANQPFWKTLGFVYQKKYSLTFDEFAKRGQDFDDRPPIWLDDASVLRHQLETNLKRTIPNLMFG